MRFLRYPNALGIYILPLRLTSYHILTPHASNDKSITPDPFIHHAPFPRKLEPNCSSSPWKCIRPLLAWEDSLLVAQPPHPTAKKRTNADPDRSSHRAPRRYCSAYCDAHSYRPYLASYPGRCFCWPPSPAQRCHSHNRNPGTQSP